jgi:hypothetical protein
MPLMELIGPIARGAEDSPRATPSNGFFVPVVKVQSAGTIRPISSISRIRLNL